MAVKVVNDDEVRVAFEKILWVSVGQEPDVRELLASLMKQINEQTLKPDLSDNDALAEVKKAAKGLKCLLVLDDVVSEEHSTPRGPRVCSARPVRMSHIFIARNQWEAKFERALNVIDPHTSSKLMVTTRIRGLIKGGSEVAVGTLSQRDALKLLAATAEVEDYVPPDGGGAEDDDQYHMACEMVELCSFLALTVIIRHHNRLPTQNRRIPIKQTCDLNGI